jgi:hypothetical protein
MLTVRDDQETRGECLQEARPCPWVSCRHHLLLEVAASKGGRDVRPTSLRLNRRRIGRGRATGRRSGPRILRAHHLVRQWINDAVEQLAGMRYSCALDVADEYPDGLTVKRGLVLGGRREGGARGRAASGPREWTAIACEECGTPCDTPGGLQQVRGRDELAAVLATRRG